MVETPNKVINAYVDRCKNCNQNLLDEIAEIKPVVIENRQYVVDYPCCGERQQGKLPEGLEAG